MSEHLTPIPWLDVLLILALIALNGVLSMSELAIVSSREARLKAMAKNGSRGAQCALEPRRRARPLPVDRAERDHADLDLRRSLFRREPWRAGCGAPAAARLQPRDHADHRLRRGHRPHHLRLAGDRRDRAQAVRAALARADRGRHVAAAALAVEDHRAVRVAARPLERAHLQAVRARSRIRRIRSPPRSFTWSSPKPRPRACWKRTSGR